MKKVIISLLLSFFVNIFCSNLLNDDYNDNYLNKHFYNYDSPNKHFYKEKFLKRGLFSFRLLEAKFLALKFPGFSSICDRDKFNHYYKIKYLSEGPVSNIINKASFIVSERILADIERLNEAIKPIVPIREMFFKEKERLDY